MFTFAVADTGYRTYILDRARIIKWILDTEFQITEAHA